MIVPIAFGVFFIVVGSFALWTGTGGVNWNSTHNRSFQRVDRVGHGQQTYNTVVARVIGPVAIIAGIVAIVIGAKK